MFFFVFCGKIVLLLLVISFRNSKASEYHVNSSAVNALLQSGLNPQIDKTGKGLLEVEAEIKALNSSIAKSVSPTVFREFRDLGEKLPKLRNELSDHKISGDHNIHKNSLNLLNNFYHVLCRQLIEIRKSLKSVEDDFRLRVVQAIRNHEFKEAEDTLNLLGDNSATSFVIREICANNTDSVELLLDFAKSLDEINRRLLVLKSLRDELRLLGRLDFLKDVKLLYSLESEILNQVPLNSTQYEDGIKFYNNIRYTLKKNATEMMTSAMLAHKFESDEKIKEFLFESYNLHKIISNEILFGVINRVFGKISNKELLNNIIFQRYIPQLEDALVYFYEKLKKAKQLDSVIFHLAQYVHQLAHPKNVLVSKRQKDLELIWNSMPTHVKILYEAQTVCLKNVEVSEYLYAASDEFSFDNNRRPVFTWVSRRKVTQGSWYVEKDLRSYDFYFVNKVHSNEYMYASDDSMGKEQRFGYVFTWRPKGRLNNKKSAWNLEVSGNYLQIRSAYNKRLLCVTSNTYPQNNHNDRRYAFTVNNEFFVLDKSCLWILEACL